MSTSGHAGPRNFWGPAKNARLAPLAGRGRAGHKIDWAGQGGAGRVFGFPGHFPVPGPRLVTGPRPVHHVVLAVSTMLFTVAMLFFAPYVNSRRILSS